MPIPFSSRLKGTTIRFCTHLQKMISHIMWGINNGNFLFYKGSIRCFEISSWCLYQGTSYTNSSSERIPQTPTDRSGNRESRILQTWSRRFIVRIDKEIILESYFTNNIIINIISFGTGDKRIECSELEPGRYNMLCLSQYNIQPRT